MIYLTQSLADLQVTRPHPETGKIDQLNKNWN